MKEQPFPKWIIEYHAQRQHAQTMNRKPMPTEIAQIMKEQSDLVILKSEMEEACALTFGFLNLDKAIKGESLRAAGRPASAIDSEAKALCSKEIWANEDAVRICKTIDARLMVAAQHLKILTGSGER